MAPAFLDPLASLALLRLVLAALAVPLGLSYLILLVLLGLRGRADR